VHGDAQCTVQVLGRNADNWTVESVVALYGEIAAVFCCNMPKKPHHLYVLFENCGVLSNCYYFTKFN